MSDYLVDEWLADKVAENRWWPNGLGYMSAWIGRRQWSLHRYVWALTHDGRVPPMLDHINGNKLDNRIENLRPATGSLNCRSRQRSSGGRLPEGVQPKPGPKPYFTHICLWRSTLYVGSYESISDASAAYENARRIILACEAKRAEIGESSQPIPPPARSASKKKWNAGWRRILLSPDFESAVSEAVVFARTFMPQQQETAA